jgi:hypothetical protein
MAAARHGKLKRFVSEALEAWLKERDKHIGPADPVREGPPWPYVSGDMIADRVSRELSTPEKSRKQLAWRLKRFRYPYVIHHPFGPPIRTTKSFYRHVKDLGLLDFLLKPPFLWEVRRAWFSRRHHELEKLLHDEAKSQHGYPLKYHRKMMLGILSHLTRISTLASEHGVPRKWFANYYAASLEHLLAEASVCYPELLRWYKPSSRIRRYPLGVDTQLDIFNAITAEFRMRHKPNSKLAHQLTALICSPQSCIANRELNPRPDTVRTNLRQRRRKASKGKTEKTGKNPA